MTPKVEQWMKEILRHAQNGMQANPACAHCFGVECLAQAVLAEIASHAPSEKEPDRLEVDANGQMWEIRLDADGKESHVPHKIASHAPSAPSEQCPGLLPSEAAAQPTPINMGVDPFGCGPSAPSALNRNDTIEYWMTRATTAELKLQEFAKLLDESKASEAAAQPTDDKIRCKYNPHNVECSRQTDYKIVLTDTGEEFGCCREHIKYYRDYNDRANREAFVIVELPITSGRR